MKRFIKFFFGLAMIVIINLSICDNVFAFTGSGQGTEASPYLISNAQQLKEMKDNLNGYYKLIANIDLQNDVWTPIGANGVPFKGSLDGGDYTISNLKISSTAHHAGFFGSAIGATLKNINIENVDITSSKSTVGGLVGSISDGKVEKCSVQGIGLVTGYTNIGGLIGRTLNSTVTESKTSINVSGNTYVGGLIGISVGDITKCYATGDVSASIDISGAAVAGGLVGSNLFPSLISECYALGNVTAAGSMVGGLVGRSSYSGTIDQLINYKAIENSFALGNVKGLDSCGGLVGNVSLINTKITNCYSAGTVTSDYPNKGGLSGSTRGIYTNCYFDSNATNLTTPTEQARTTAQLKQKLTFEGWDTKNIWRIHDDVSYPYLKNLPSPFPIVMPSPDDITYNNITANSVVVEWSAVPDATEYEIVYSDKSFTTTNLSIKIESLSSNTEYRFKVRGKNSEFDGQWSDILTIRTDLLPLDRVEGLVCTSNSNDTITIAWNSVTDAEGYEVLFGDKIISTNITSATFNGLTLNTSYTFQVRAVNSKETGELSSKLTVKTNFYSPQTNYSRLFYEKCEEQFWLIDELELILNKQAKSINTIESKEDFENVIALSVTGKNISGKIPKAIGELYNLEYLYLSKNELAGEIPAELYNLKNLKNLDLSSNKLTGKVSLQISDLTRLEILLLHKNDLDGTIPNAICSLTQLKNLDLGNNNFEGQIPENIGNLTNLKFLSLSDNKLIGTLPASFSKLTKLEVIILSNNIITGSKILENFLETSNFKLIDLSNSSFAGDISENLRQKSDKGENSGVTVVVK